MKISENIWKKSLLSKNSSIEEAIINLSEFGLKIILVVDNNNKLEGTISDGDIRSGLLRGLILKSPIDSIINKNSITVPFEIKREVVLQLMVINKVQQIPKVDKNQIVRGLFIWDEITTPSLKNNIFVIMAGGKGTRLLPHTENCPKPLVEISGKPMLLHIIERAKKEGFFHFYIAINYLGEMIEEYFKDGSDFGVDIKYLKETIQLGTAGSLSLLPPNLNDQIIVTNGDVITDIKYSDILNFHKKHEAIATMAVRGHEWQHPFGVVNTNGVDITGFEEKPIYKSNINAGVYVLSPNAIKKLNYNEHRDMPELFTELSKNSELTVAYPMHEPWLDVGKPDDLEQATKEMSAIKSNKNNQK